ncbi:hypothetical protein, partial [Klebsiella pneumoniae]|uniref:hypothetical protein n=1 Tax=Klebsiella pneumoniae TaxID=573 RepID=UPI0034E96169
KAKIDLEIAEDKARDIDTMMKQRAYYIEKEQQIEKDLLEQNGENNRLQQMKAIKQRQDIDANKLAAELKSVQDEITLIQSQNEAYLKRITSDEFQNP